MSLDLPAHCTVKDAIFESIKLVNNKLETLNYNNTIPDRTDNYKLQYAKKSGLPNKDFPGWFFVFL